MTLILEADGRSAPAETGSNAHEGAAQDGSLVNGSASATGATRSERFPDPPHNALSVLKTFMETQQRRVNHWKEYDEAIEEHLKQVVQPPRRPSGTADLGELQSASGREAEPAVEGQGEDAQQGSNARPLVNRHDGQHRHAHSHYESTPQPLDDELVARVISLVTSGLLDCGHETRAIELELTHSANLQPDGAPLGRLIGQVQDRENEVLRKVVKRDQIRRVRAERQKQRRKHQQQHQQQQEGGSGTANADRDTTAAAAAADEDDDDEEEVAQILTLDEEIRQLREGAVTELLEEIRAEMTDLELAAS